MAASVVRMGASQSIMFILIFYIILKCCCSNSDEAAIQESGESKETDIVQKNTVFVAILARNKAHTLPHFLTLFENLDYPKSRISIWIRSDHNVDDTIAILNTWIHRVRELYHSVDIDFKNSPPFYFPDEQGPFHWSESRFQHVINLREQGLTAARQAWADFIWFLDCDVLLTNPKTLEKLMEQKKVLVAPMLHSAAAYSNYWCGMTEKYYYFRTDDYMPILERKKKGCFEVPMIHSSHLLDLRFTDSQYLTFDPEQIPGYSGPDDDIIAFALSAKYLSVPMNILNSEFFGYITTPLETGNSLEDDKVQLVNIKLEVMVDNPPLQVHPTLLQFTADIPNPDKMGFDEVYLINLLRRPERRIRMMASFKELGIDAKVLDAVDGKTLDPDVLKQNGVIMMPEYADPYHKRPITMGEMGCFFSHYKIWKEMVDKQLRAAIVFEDDIRFEPFFRKKVQAMMTEIRTLNLNWDLIYLGRKRLMNSTEPYVEGSRRLVHVDYSYWTLCYMITLDGAKKLLGAEPLSKIVPVDEYLPIMYDRHPEKSWKSYYPNRNLKAFSSEPLLVYPTHYTGEIGYISDTEDSSQISNSKGNIQKTEL